jgi:hypothetical protein
VTGRNSNEPAGWFVGHVIRSMLHDALTPDLVLLDGKVLCMDAAGSTAQAVAVKNGRVLALGSNA